MSVDTQPVRSVTLAPPGADLFASRAEALVNTVNCVGAMGKGLALQFRNRYPDNLRLYQDECRAGRLRPGGLAVCGPRHDMPRFIVNLATKDHFRDPSRLEWVVAGARELRQWAEDRGVRTIACPALGAGLGGLDWDAVRGAVLEVFDGADVQLTLYAPQSIQWPAPTTARFPESAWPRQRVLEAPEPRGFAALRRR